VNWQTTLSAAVSERVQLHPLPALIGKQDSHSRFVASKSCLTNRSKQSAIPSVGTSPVGAQLEMTV